MLLSVPSGSTLCLLMVLCLVRVGAQTVERQANACRPLPADASSLDRFERARVLQTGQVCERDLPAAIRLYRELLLGEYDPQVRRAQMELGNLVLDGDYTSGEAKLDLFWARTITQELIGQEQFKLAFANGSAMDLPSSPEVTALVIRTAASYNVDLAQRQMAARVPADESAAWMRLAGQTFTAFQDKAEAADKKASPEQRRATADSYVDLLQSRAANGAFYRRSDPLFDPGVIPLETLLSNGTDPDAQLRLAFYYELRATSDPAYAMKAQALYRSVRDGRVSSVRFKIGSMYEHATEGFPKDAGLAAQWYGFAVKAGSEEACERILDLQKSAAISAEQAKAPLTRCPRLLHREDLVSHEHKTSRLMTHGYTFSPDSAAPLRG